jgi:hypothetical protein
VPDCDLSPEFDVFRRRANQHSKRAGLDRPVQIAIEQLQVVVSNLERDVAMLAGLEMNALKLFERDDRLRDRCDEIANVELRNLVARASA